MKMTPPLLVKGSYVLKEPFSVDPAVTYSCMAVRSFNDIYELGKDVYTVYYEPHDISQEDFENDKVLAANIITLMSDNDDVVYVPDTYIASYPDVSGMKYSHMVLSLSLGALPDTLNLAFLEEQVGNLVSEVIGVTPEVRLHKAPHTDVITPDQHVALETARTSAINLRETTHAKVLKIQNQLAATQAERAALEQILKDNDLL